MDTEISTPYMYRTMTASQELLSRIKDLDDEESLCLRMIGNHHKDIERLAARGAAAAKKRGELETALRALTAELNAPTETPGRRVQIGQQA